MSEHKIPGNLPFEGPTVPSSPLIKGELPGTDPVSGLDKWRTPGTDPLSQVALNPQPLPPTNLTPSAIGGNRSLPAIQHGLRNTIIIVCIITLLLIAGGLALKSALPNAPVGALTITIRPGVVLRERQVQVSNSAKELAATSGSARCADSSQGTLDERLVGGGFTSDDDHGNIVQAQSSYPSALDGNWYGYFLPQVQGHAATVIAVCLREPASFFNGLQSFDIVQSLPKKTAHDDKYPAAAIAVAACPMGEAILGGGYESEYSGGGVYSIDASYPMYANGVGQWNVAFHIDPSNGLQRVQLRAYAICSKGLVTHLEHKAIAGIATRKNPYTQDSMPCASGTLLTGGYQITAPPSLVAIGDDSPLNDITRNPVSGDFVQQWYVEASSSGWQAGVSPGDVWVTCLDLSNSAATVTTPRTTPSPAVLPTNTPRPRATATATPTLCQSIVAGSGAMNVDNSYLNVDSSTGIGHTLSGTQAHWDPASGTIVSVNGAAFSNKGV